jgi:Tetratricopeptide repeat
MCFAPLRGWWPTPELPVARTRHMVLSGRAVGDIPQQPPGFQPRADLLAELDAAAPGVSVVHVVTGIRGVGKTQLAATYARAKLAAGWRLVAWVNAEDPRSLLAGLAAVAEAAGLVGEAAADTGLAVRHWLEDDGDQRLLVFDDATDADVLRPYVPAGGAARVLITSNRQSVANLGFRVGVEVFTKDEAVTFLADQIGLADSAGAETVAEELGYLPLALAQATAVIAAQHLPYGTYLERLRALPVGEYLARQEGQSYPHGVAEAVLLSLETVRAGDRTGVCIRVMEIVAVLSAAGVRRDMLHDAGQAGVLAAGRRGRAARTSAAVVDGALGRLAERSLLSFSLDGQAVTAHRLVLRVIREGLARQGRFTAVCRAAAAVLETRAEALEGSRDRSAVRDFPDQVMTLWENTLSPPGQADDELARMLLRLRLSALYYLKELGDRTPQAIVVGEPLTADLERVLGPDHPSTLASRNNLAGAYLEAGRAAEAIPLFEQVLADRERVLGPAQTMVVRAHPPWTWLSPCCQVSGPRGYVQASGGRKSMIT